MKQNQLERGEHVVEIFECAGKRVQVYISGFNRYLLIDGESHKLSSLDIAQEAAKRILTPRE